MFSSDDYNAYHGGMIATVRALTGKAPRSYTGDSSDRQRIVVRTVKEEAARLFRGKDSRFSIKQVYHSISP